MKKLLALIIGTLITTSCAGGSAPEPGLQLDREGLPQGVGKFQNGSIVCYVLDPWQRSGVAISCVRL